MTSISNLNIESARAEFFQWRKSSDNVGKEAMVAKVQEATQGLLTEAMTLNFCHFREGYGFDFYYGEKPDGKKFIPITIEEGETLKWQTAQKVCLLPLKDPSTGAYFLSTVKIIQVDHRAYTTKQILSEALEKAEKNSSSDDFRMLEALTPYAAMLDNETSEKLAKMFSDNTEYASQAEKTREASTDGNEMFNE